MYVKVTSKLCTYYYYYLLPLQLVCMCVCVSLNRRRVITTRGNDGFMLEPLLEVTGQWRKVYFDHLSLFSIFVVWFLLVHAHKRKVQIFSIKSAKLMKVRIELEVKNATYSKDLVVGIILYIHTDVYIWWLLTLLPPL